MCPPIGSLKEVFETIFTIIITVNHNHIMYYHHHHQYPHHHVTCVLTHRLSALTQYVAAQAMGVHTLHTLENQIRRQTFLLVPNTNQQLERYIWKETWFCIHSRVDMMLDTFGREQVPDKQSMKWKYSALSLFSFLPGRLYTIILCKLMYWMPKSILLWAFQLKIRVSQDCAMQYMYFY